MLLAIRTAIAERRIGSQSMESVTMSNLLDERLLLQIGVPVEHDGERRNRVAVKRLIDDKALVAGNIVRPAARLCANGEKRFGHAGLEGIPGLDLDFHDLVVRAEVEDSLSIASPARLRSARGRDQPFPRGYWKRLYVHLVSSRDAGGVRQPTPVRRQPRAAIDRRRLDNVKGFAVGTRVCVDIETRVRARFDDVVKQRPTIG